ncbi:MAG: hydrogenase nickel incorporation protein HypB [Calditrichaeota bacterium]|nr:hydrogenase nickel incorporation protein HypB [Calditrichota bacterium]
MPPNIDIPIVRDVLEESHKRALENRQLLNKHHIFAVNLMSSPGSGKTTLLEKTIPLIHAQNLRCAIIEGDIATTLDSQRLKPLGAPVVQANTQPFGGDCHIGAHLVQAALKFLNLEKVDILFIENVGNLVCPAEFYLGEDLRIVMLSVVEGEDKPLKYPLMFRECNACILTKMDLLPFSGTDIANLRRNLLNINGKLATLELSARTEDGLENWIDWLLQQRTASL